MELDPKPQFLRLELLETAVVRESREMVLVDTNVGEGAKVYIEAKQCDASVELLNHNYYTFGTS